MTGRYQVHQASPEGRRLVYTHDDLDFASLVAIGNRGTEIRDGVTNEPVVFGVPEAVDVCDRHPMTDFRGSEAFPSLWGWQVALELAVHFRLPVPPRTQEIHRIHEAITAKLGERVPGLMAMSLPDHTVRTRIQALAAEVDPRVKVEVILGEKLVITPDYNEVQAPEAVDA